MTTNSARPSASEFTDPYAQCLADLGLIRQARRVEDPGYHRAFRYPNSPPELIYYPFDSMLRTDFKYAEELAREQHLRFSALEYSIGECFTAMAFSVRLSTDPARGDYKQFIYRTRKLIKRVAPNAISKIGTNNDYLVIKVFSPDPIDEAALISIKEVVSMAGIRFTGKTYAHGQIDQQLRKLTAPDLPVDDNPRRAALEWVLFGIRQVVIHSKACSEICVYFPHKIGPEVIGDPCTDKFLPKSSVPERRRHSKTEELASHYTERLAYRRKLSDIESHEWNQFPDVEEVDNTSPAESARMMAEHG